MRGHLITLAVMAGTVVIAEGAAFADSHKGDGLSPATPIEMFACSYADGKGPGDLDGAVKDFNAWADKHDVTEYTAWTLEPYYTSPEQEFDVIWLGGTEKAAVLGAIQDQWLATGAREAEQFNEIVPCDTHANFAALQFKEPPERENPANVVVSFTDCTMADGVSFDDMIPGLVEWSSYREGHGSASGMWVFFPAYGAGRTLRNRAPTMTSTTRAAGKRAMSCSPVRLAAIRRAYTWQRIAAWRKTTNKTARDHRRSRCKRETRKAPRGAFLRQPASSIL